MIKNCVGNKQVKGFTLVEILVVLGIFAVISVVGVSLLFSLLRGATKSRMIAKVKQNGNYAINVMERVLRNASGFNYDAGGHSEISVVDLDGIEHVFACDSPAGHQTLLYARDDSASSGLIDEEIVVLGDCNIFNVELEPDSPPAIIIDFSLQLIAGDRPEEESTVKFEKKVVLRNY